MSGLVLAEAASSWLAFDDGAIAERANEFVWDVIWLLLILGPIAFGATYSTIWSNYRNTDKSHAFERETRINSKPVVAHDTKVSKVKGVTRSQIERENRRKHRERVRRVK